MGRECFWTHNVCGSGITVQEGRGLRGGCDWNRFSLVLSLLPHRGREEGDSRLTPSDVLNLAFRGDAPFLCFACDSAAMLV